MAPERPEICFNKREVVSMDIHRAAVNGTARKVIEQEEV
jgi:hypothetical protein